MCLELLHTFTSTAYLPDELVCHTNLCISYKLPICALKGLFLMLHPELYDSKSL